MSDTRTPEQHMADVAEDILTKLSSVRNDLHELFHDFATLSETAEEHGKPHTAHNLAHLSASIGLLLCDQTREIVADLCGDRIIVGEESALKYIEDKFPELRGTMSVEDIRSAFDAGEIRTI